MNIDQQLWQPQKGWSRISMSPPLKEADWVLVFGGREELENEKLISEIQGMYPRAVLTSCSTAGEILNEQIHEHSLSLTAVQFEKTQLKAIACDLESAENHTEIGQQIGRALLADDLRLVFVLSDGHSVNVGELVDGINGALGHVVPVTGGLAGDGINFQRTLVGLNGPPASKQVIALGLYGDDLIVGHGSKGGWRQFGAIRTVTRSEGNVLYELDGQNALALYKEYLGERAKDLPGSALLFPLALEFEDRTEPLVRTVMSVDEEHQSMTFAGDLPVGSKCRLMHATFDNIVDGAAQAAQSSLHEMDSFEPQLSILISCVGRRLLLGLRAEEEIEEVRHVIGPDSPITGFYSYGELSPLGNQKGCQLHNQTMTITTLAER